MGFKEQKKLVIQSLSDGNYVHESRTNIDTKNLLLTGEVTEEELIKVLKKSKGTDFECSPHHTAKGIEVNIIKVTQSGIRWYIKWYIIEPDLVFISVHH